MNIGSMCNRDVVGVPRDTTIAEAARVMRTNHIGNVLVLDESDGDKIPIGIVTDRDIVIEVIAAGLDPDELKVGDLLTAKLVIAHETESCEDTIRLMALNGVRRMPVVDAEGCLVGVVTLDDLLPYFAAPLAQLSELASRGRNREINLRR